MKTLERPTSLSDRLVFVVSKSVLRDLPHRRGRFIPLRTRSAIQEAMSSPAAEGWLAADRQAASDLLAVASQSRATKRRLGHLVFLEPPQLENLATALDLFGSVAWANDRKHWLPLDELLGVLSAPHPEDYVIGGSVDPDAHTLTVSRGDFRRLTVPLSTFEPSGMGVVINPGDFEVIDSGQAVRLGEYEAAADAILYEWDPEYRQRLRSQRRAEEKTFGASLRRLRLQRGLRQSDFEMPARTIARIERGEVAKPHGRTLAKIAARLGVLPEEIESY